MQSLKKDVFILFLSENKRYIFCQIIIERLLLMTFCCAKMSSVILDKPLSME